MKIEKWSDIINVFSTTIRFWI